MLPVCRLDESAFGKVHLGMRRMKQLNILLVCLLVAGASLPVDGWSQRRAASQRAAKSVQKQKKTKEKEQEEDPLTPELLANTQRVLVFDSLVVPLDHFVGHLPLGAEQGRLTTYDEFFHSTGHPNASLYVNDMGNACVFSRQDKNGGSRLYSSYLVGGKWSNAQELKGLGEEGDFTHTGHPFLMSDGVTLFFSAKGKNSLGGWDLYRSTYDASSGRYMKAESLGLPFCSTGDDLLYAVNEADSVGMLVSTRGQAQGHVCIYFFTPTIVREVYDPSEMEDQQMRQLATLAKISLTGKDWASERKSGLARLERARKKQAREQATGQKKSDEVCFVVNDQLTYTQMSQFRSDGAAGHYARIGQLQHQEQRLLQALDDLRARYAKKVTDELTRQILEKEKALEQCQRDLKSEENALRQKENQKLSAQ